MDAPAAPADAHASRSPVPRRRRQWILGTVGVLLLLAGTTFGIAALAQPEPRAPDDAFRFEQVYVMMSEDEDEQTTLLINGWFTNTAHARMRQVRIVAVAVDTTRNIAVDRNETSLAELARRTTQDATLGLRVNSTRPHQVDLLVLIEGLQVARGYAHFGPSYSYVEGKVDTLEGDRMYRVASSFTFDYRN